jgi:N-acetylneuraminate synthase
MATAGELEDAVCAARAAGCRDVILLKCTSTYPANPEDTNILTIPHMRSLFNREVGLSDHTMGIGVAVASVALGATVIEKHFTLNRGDGGVDSAFSLEPAEMTQLVSETERAWRALGRVEYGSTEAEEGARQFRRSLYVVQDIKAGEVLTKENVRAIRPGYGLSTRYYDVIVGKKAVCDIRRGSPVTWGLVTRQ